MLESEIPMHQPEEDRRLMILGVLQAATNHLNLASESIRTTPAVQLPPESICITLGQACRIEISTDGHLLYAPNNPSKDLIFDLPPREDILYLPMGAGPPGEPCHRCGGSGREPK